MCRILGQLPTRQAVMCGTAQPRYSQRGTGSKRAGHSPEVHCRGDVAGRRTPQPSPACRPFNAPCSATVTRPCWPLLQQRGKHSHHERRAAQVAGAAAEGAAGGSCQEPEEPDPGTQQQHRLYCQLICRYGSPPQLGSGRYSCGCQCTCWHGLGSSAHGLGGGREAGCIQAAGRLVIGGGGSWGLLLVRECRVCADRCLVCDFPQWDCSSTLHLAHQQLTSHSHTTCAKLVRHPIARPWCALLHYSPSFAALHPPTPTAKAPSLPPCCRPTLRVLPRAFPGWLQAPPSWLLPHRGG